MVGGPRLPAGAVLINPACAFTNVNWALLVGSKPRGPGMERKDLIRSNGPIFVGQGKALSQAHSNIRVVVVGNPCNSGLFAKFTIVLWWCQASTRRLEVSIPATM